MVLDKSKSFVLVVANQGNPYISAFTFDASVTGKLDTSATGTSGNAPVAIAAVPR
jgi:hypothetical protein